LPLASTLEAEASEANKATPIFMAHGTQDPVVVLDRAEASNTKLNALGYSVEWHTYPMPHSVHPREVADISAFLKYSLQAVVNK
jgi:phospholipase/carboxylesterase